MRSCERVGCHKEVKKPGRAYCSLECGRQQWKGNFSLKEEPNRKMYPKRGG